MGKKSRKYQIEKVLDRKISNNNHFEYLIKFKGLKYPLWEPIENLKKKEYMKKIRLYDNKYPKFINSSLMNRNELIKLRKKKQNNSKYYKMNNLNIIILSDSEDDTDSYTKKNFIDVKEIDINEIKYYKNELEKIQKENFILKSELKDKENNINELIKNIEEKNIEYQRMKDNYQSLNNEYGKIIQKFKTLRQKLKENNLN